MGYTCGLYTSPHLESVNERICADAPISDNELLKALIKIQSVENSSGLTYFDLLTAAAFIFFSEKKLNYAAIECGLGGRMDSTNVVNPLCSIITTISISNH